MTRPAEKSASADSIAPLSSSGARTARTSSSLNQMAMQHIVVPRRRYTGRVKLLASLCCLAACAWSAGPEFRLRDTTGAVHTAAEWQGRKAVVLFFVMTDCPIGNSYVPEMNRIREAYGPKGVALYAVQAETSTGETAVAKYAQEF